MRFGSVCSGIEAASVAWHPLGWRAEWLAEIEPFPAAVLAHHYPDVPNIGDMTKLLHLIPSGEVAAPDVFCGGTPCQAFSVAGLRRSLDDARGNLSLTFCEIANAIDTVRVGRGDEPAIIFWENVPGVLSTSDNAFGCFLAGLAGEDDPLVAPGGKWTNAGCVYGPSRTVAWRVLDAQYFGVAQRRRRVFVVASARTGFDPIKVLFEFDGVRRDTAPSRQAGEEITPTIRAGATNGSPGHGQRSGDSRDELIVPVTCMAHGQGMAEIAENRSPTPTCNHEAPIAAYSTKLHNTTSNQAGKFYQEYATSLDRSSPPPAVICPVATRDVAQTLTSNYGKQCDNSDTALGPNVVIAPVSVSLRGREGGATAELGDEVGSCLRASGGGGDKAHVLAPVAMRESGQGYWMEDNIAGTLRAEGEDRPSRPSHVIGQPPAMQVRRLTPVECERLQGFSDGYTAIPWRKKPADQCPDGPRYKALGNSWAVPVVRWIGSRIHAAVMQPANDNGQQSGEAAA